MDTPPLSIQQIKCYYKSLQYFIYNRSKEFLRLSPCHYTQNWVTGIRQSRNLSFLETGTDMFFGYWNPHLEELVTFGIRFSSIQFLKKLVHMDQGLPGTGFVCLLWMIIGGGSKPFTGQSPAWPLLELIFSGIGSTLISIFLELDHSVPLSLLRDPE